MLPAARMLTVVLASCRAAIWTGASLHRLLQDYQLLYLHHAGKLDGSSFYLLLQDYQLLYLHHAGQLFGWELFATFILVSTVFAVAIGKPNFGVAGPFIVGVALWASALCSEFHYKNSQSLHALMYKQTAR